MNTYETDAVRAERERRETQDAIWDNARAEAQDIVDGLEPGEWLTTTDFILRIQEQAKVERQIVVAVIHELRDAGKVAYSLSKGYRNAAVPGEDGIALLTRPEDVSRRNNFLEFLAEMQAEARSQS